MSDAGQQAVARDGHRFASVTDYAAAYREGRCTPVDVARQVVELVARSDRLEPPMRLFIAQSERDLLQQAQQAASRHQRGEPLGLWDGVPVAVKDELDQAGYPTTVGTGFLRDDGPVTVDAEAVSRLRRAGALLVGKANMQEIGLGVTGINPHHGAARNPYGPDRMTGGSSSGSGAVVGSGLCPVALGADGGGSIRIPAALCGVIGIKPTYGRVSEAGAAPLCWSLAHIGPLAASVDDAARALAVIAGPDRHDENTLGQPALGQVDLLPADSGHEIDGLRVGWCETWSAEAEATVLAACRQGLDWLVESGAQLREVHIGHRDQVRVAQYVTIGVEMAASQHERRRRHRREYAADTRLLLEAASRVSGVDYVRAQRLRTLIARAFAAVFELVDVIVTPTTARTAPPLHADALAAGESDDAVLRQLTAFSFAANLVGVPAISVPVGYDPQGLPIGLQLIGRHWDEATLLRAARVVEARLARRAPTVGLCPLDLAVERASACD